MCQGTDFEFRELGTHLESGAKGSTCLPSPRPSLLVCVGVCMCVCTCAWLCAHVCGVGAVKPTKSRQTPPSLSHSPLG